MSTTDPEPNDEVDGEAQGEPDDDVRDALGETAVSGEEGPSSADDGT